MLGLRCDSVELYISISGLILAALGTYFAYLQVRQASIRRTQLLKPELSVAPSGPIIQPAITCADLRIASVSELEDLGATTDSIIVELVKMDYDNLAGATEIDVGQVTTWSPIVENNHDGMCLVVNHANQIVAYWHFIPLDDDSYAKAKQGTLDDGLIRVSDMNILGPPGDYNLYFMIICIAPHYRGVRVLRMLLDAFADTLLMLARKGIYFPELCATAFTPEGEALCRTLHMQQIALHAARGTVYWMDFRKMPAGVFYQDDLVALYKHRYKS